MAQTNIHVRGAREHNLKNIDVVIPRDKLVVLTGLSGSGKSSLAFDTIYAEGQRRYVESLSSYARQFLGQMEKPDIDYIDGLSPAISIDQKTTSRNPRSTVGTVTEVYDYLRLLYSRVGVPHCPVCGKEIRQQTVDQIVDAIMALPEGARVQMLSPVVRGKKGEHAKVFDDARRGGFARVRVDGIPYDLSEDIGRLDKQKKHSIEIIVDRVVVKESARARIAEAVEIATSLSGGLVIADVIDGEELSFSQNYACEEHGISMEELAPRMFSFNNPFGACPSCLGIGSIMRIDPELIIPNKNLTVREGAIKAGGWNFGDSATIAQMYFEGLSAHYGFSLDVPIRDLAQKHIDVMLYGTKGERIEIRRRSEYGSGVYKTAFEGVVNNLERRYKDTQSEYVKHEIEGFMATIPCEACKGARLKPESLAVTVGGMNIHELTGMPIVDEIGFFKSMALGERDMMIAEQILKEIIERLTFLQSVGLDYLTLAREAGSLSGGEAQRIRLATQIGSSLMGVLYILDEPSIGLHQRDNHKLLGTLRRLRDIGNTLIVVEHDEDTMFAADHIIDIGPGAGIHGGEVVAQGTAQEIMQNEASITGQYLSGKKRIEVPKKRRKPNGKKLTIRGARENNLKNLNVDIPLGVFVAVTGVSGSGKSSLINEILYKKLVADLNRARTRHGDCDGIDGVELLDKVINIDQSPIGRTPRSNPATYTGTFTDIRDVFAKSKEAAARGYGPGRFSFNVKGGRCEACQGDGIIKIEMHFLPDIYVPCEVCKGNRYNRETLEVRFKDKNIAEVLDMTIEEGVRFFENIPKIHRKLDTLSDVGLSYVKLGQPATTLSGGEAQRVKLATELARRATGRTIDILDEPTTGLHTADVHKLIDVLQKFVDAGNTVVVIEHNLDVIKTADYVIDLGPEGGDKGGEVVAVGTPEQVAGNPASYTGQYLKKVLKG